MDFKRLSIRNFLTIGHAELELDGRGLILIQGENTDDTSAKSNGAGKSSIVDALSWCLFGETAREVSGDLVVNDTAGKDCSVEVLLDDDGTQYKVQRYRKHKVHKNALMVSQLNAGTWMDLSKGTDRETQLVVDKIIGCTLPVFVGAIYAGQEKMPDLPGMTDKHLKLLIEEAAGVEELAEAYKEASKRALVVEKEHTAAATMLKSLGQRLTTLLDELANAKVELQAFEDGRKGRAGAELARAKPLNESKTEAVAKLAEFDEPALLARKAELEAELASHKTQDAELARLAREEREVGDKVTRFRSTVEQLKGAHAKTESNLAAVESQVGQPCGECGKAYCAEDLHTVKTMRVEGIATAKKVLLEAATGARAAIAEHATKKQAVADYRESMTDVSAAAAELSTVTSNIGVVGMFKRTIETIERNIEAVRTAAKGKLTEGNPWTKAVESKQADMEKADKDVGAAHAAVTALETKLELYSNAAKVFGPAGVRAHILDTVTPFLNAKTGEYLGALADGNIHAVWSTLSKTAKGELKEKFNIDVTNDKGGKTFKALSGGEKRKVRISAAMALQDMVATRASKPINLFMADEIDHALDEPGLERLMTVLDKKAKERGTVLVVSHNSLSDWIDSVITVTKVGGVSTVTGATERGF